MRKRLSLVTMALFVFIVTAFATDIGPWPEDPAEYQAWKRAYIESRRPAMPAGGPLRREMTLDCENGYVAAAMSEESGVFDQGADPSGGGS